MGNVIESRNNVKVNPLIGCFKQCYSMLGLYKYMESTLIIIAKARIPNGIILIILLRQNIRMQCMNFRFNENPLENI